MTGASGGGPVDTIEIPVGDMTFRARAAGPEDGRLVLLLHGFPESSLEWRRQLPALAAAGYRAIAPDQRGYSAGARPGTVADYAGPHLVADVLAIADWLGGHEIDLVGHDWGGAVAWMVAGRYPERLRSLTVVSTPHLVPFAAARDDDEDQRRRSRYIATFRDEGGAAERLFLDEDAAGLRKLYASAGMEPEVIDEYVALFQEPGALTAALNWYRAGSLNDPGEMGAIPTPTLYVWSDGDNAVGRTAAEATADYVSGPYRFEVLAGISHWIPEAAPDRLNELLLEHLAATA